MSRHVVAAIVVVVLGVLAVLGVRFIGPVLREQMQRDTSDAAALRGRIRVGIDNWVGYFPLCSPEMRRRILADGYDLRCEDDRADYAARFQRLGDGELQFAVGTVDAYLLGGGGADFPGAIVAVLDESKGGDAIVANKAVVPTLDALKTARGVRITYTDASPSAHLFKSVGVHFDLPQMADATRAWYLPSDGSADALKKLRAGEAQVAVLWQPDVSLALADPNLVKLMGTEDTDKLIVDILLASRKVIQEDPEIVGLLLRRYFETLDHYQRTPGQLRADVAQATALPVEQVEAMLDGVDWADLGENAALWFGTGSAAGRGNGLNEAIGSAAGILVAAGDVDQNPLPDQDPYRITNSQFVAALMAEQASAPVVADGNDGLSRGFAPLDEAGWSRLRPVGTLRIEAVSFARATAQVDTEGEAALKAVTEKLAHYPNFRLVVRGHTGTDGDAEANQALSRERAQAVSDYLQSHYGVDADRVLVLGLGSSEPLPRLPDESERAYRYRLPRVEFMLMAERF